MKLRAERKCGELLAAMPKQTGGDAMKARSHDATEVPASLTELGLDKSQSSRWQAVASLALWTGPDEPLRRELLNQWTAGAWQAWSYTRASKRSAVTKHAITIALRPNPKPSNLAFPDFETADHMEEVA